MESQRGKYLFKNSMIFALGNFGTRFISFFLVPIYTNILTTSQYGIIDMIYTVGMVIAPILILNLCEAVLRFPLDDGADYNAIMSTGLAGLLIGGSIGLLLVPCASLFALLKPYVWYLYFYVISFAFSQMMLCGLRGKELLLRYSIGNIIYSLSVATSNIVFLVILHKGIEGYLMAYILSNFVTAIYAFLAGDTLDVISHFRIDRSLTKQMIIYSTLLIPTTFTWWIMDSSDRIMVTTIAGGTENGIYAVAYKLPTLLSTLAAVFNQAWAYSAIREQKSEDRVAYNNKICSNVIAVLLIGASGLMMVMKLFLKIYVGSDYYVAWKYTPVLIIGLLFMNLGSFVATSYTVNKDSKGFLKSGVIGGITNIVLNFLLIPICGAMGAAIATCFSYFTVLVYRMWDTGKYLKLDIVNTKNTAGIVLLIITGFTMFIDSLLGQAILIIEFFIMLSINGGFVRELFQSLRNYFVKK